MQQIKSLIFDGCFYLFSGLYLLIFFVPMLLLPRSFAQILFQIWTKSVFFILKITVGLEHKVEGKHFLQQALKNGPCIIACKHQSLWETIIFSTLVPNFVTILKKELLFIPLFGSYLKKLNSIAISRGESLKSLKEIVVNSKKAIANQSSILIFPEGTRSMYEMGIAPPYKVGVAYLYSNLQIPVLPVALNSGKFWARKSFCKKPGTITLKFLQPIEPGLKKNEFMERLHSSIENACKEL